MTEIIHNGVVNSISANNITVTITRNEACNNCALKDSCAKLSAEQLITVESSCPQNYKIGQPVELVIAEQQASVAAFLGYILPLIITLTILFGVLSISSNETLAAVLSLVSIPLYYGLLCLWKSRLRKILKINLR